MRLVNRQQVRARQDPARQPYEVLATGIPYTLRLSFSCVGDAKTNKVIGETGAIHFRASPSRAIWDL
jgi:hypothetical protein